MIDSYNIDHVKHQDIYRLSNTIDDMSHLTLLSRSMIFLNCIPSKLSTTNAAISDESDESQTSFNFQ